VLVHQGRAEIGGRHRAERGLDHRLVGHGVAMVLQTLSSVKRSELRG
jgi:hypothetical protein